MGNKVSGWLNTYGSKISRCELTVWNLETEKPNKEESGNVRKLIALEVQVFSEAHDGSILYAIR